MSKPSKSRTRRRGAVALLAAFLLIPLMTMIAFAVDYGFLLKTRTDMQRAADLAALAAVQELLPDDNGKQSIDAVRTAIRDYVPSSIGTSFTVLNSDIEIGRYDPATIYANVSLLNTGVLDTVRVTLRHDQAANSPISLFFARVFGSDQADLNVTASAALQKAKHLFPGAKILPFAVPLKAWDARSPGEEWSIYGDGKIEDDRGKTVPGNWGTVDIGSDNNSTSDLRNQIRDGLRQSDLDALYVNGRIPSHTMIDGGQSFWANADPGLSSGVKDAVQDVHGLKRLVPIYDSVNGAAAPADAGKGKKKNGKAVGGNNAEYHIVGWGVVTVVDSNWGGAKNTSVTIRKSQMYDSGLLPQRDLSQTSGSIEGAYTSPVLLQ